MYAWVCQEISVAKCTKLIFPFSSYLHVCNHIPRPHILKIKEACAMGMLLPLYVYVQIEIIKC